MGVTVINQAPSEPRLHRVLYVVKYLRAMALNLVLTLLAAGLFLVAGIKGLYPLADEAISALQAQQAQLDEMGSPIGQNFIPFIFGTSIVTLAFYVWVYFSITRVWCRSLKFQAGFLLFSVLFMPVWAWPQVKFSLESLHPLFSAFVIAAFAGMLVIVVDIVVALWGVSRAPERSGFTALLDPRLAPGWWTYINKFFDLPRTPLRNPRIVMAYLLSFAAAIVLIASITYLLSVGGAQGKLAMLAAGCGPANMGECMAQSVAWARHIPLLLVIALAGTQAAGYMQGAAKRLGGRSVSDVLRSSDDRFILYLRPFDTDDVILPKPRLPFLSTFLSFRPFPVRIEEEFFDVADGYRLLIAVGKPGETASEGGLAYRAYYEESEWQRAVLDRIRRADAIVMVLEDTKGVNWEISKVLSEGAAEKTLFFFDPDSKDPALWDGLANKMLPQFASAGLLPPGFAFEGRPIAFYFRGGEIFEIQNSNWTATSYRTAFSHFLAERAG